MFFRIEVKMRKKSHISLAKGVIHGLDIGERVNHRLSFFVGSIWPDCTPSFLTKRHCIDDTFDIMAKKMDKFISKYNADKDMGISSTWRMGIVLHYIADYFTYPHNSNYPGGFKDHCIYEEELKHRMYKYVADMKMTAPKQDVPVFASTKQILEYIKNIHNKYMQLDGRVDYDCGYSVRTCMSVMASLLYIAGKKEMALAA